jgi:hypothetical protein
MRALMMTGIREPLSTRDVPDPNLVQGKFEFAFMRLASAAPTCTCGVVNYLFPYRLFLVTNPRDSSMPPAPASVR